MTRNLSVGTRILGSGQPCFIIAEAGVNHNGDPDLAMALVDAAQKAGADAVKFQTFKAERLVSKMTPMADYQKQNTGTDKPMIEMLRQLEMSDDLHDRLHKYCRRRGILFLSSPFDEVSADFLYHLGLPAFKIPSGELTNLPFLRHLAKLGRPLIISTGMASLAEVGDAVRAVEAAGNSEIVLLHCLSNYPADPREVNLRAMQTMSAAFDMPIGYSDHVLGNEAALAAVALGACVIEKHFTINRSLPGPDHQASLEPAELESLVRGIRMVEQTLGDGIKRPMPSELKNHSVSRKSIVAASDILAGDIFSTENLTVKRPATGLSPMLWDKLLGTRAPRNFQCDEPIALEGEVQPWN